MRLFVSPAEARVLVDACNKTVILGPLDSMARYYEIREAEDTIAALLEWFGVPEWARKIHGATIEVDVMRAEALPRVRFER